MRLFQITPAQLTPASFSKYTPKAQRLALDSLPLLQQLPLGFAPFLLKEIVGSEVKFPAELTELEAQLAYLKAMSPAALSAEMQPFASLTLTPALESYDWVNSPAQFLEQLSAQLWASHQMDTFRTASEVYVGKFHATLKPAPLPTPRVGVVVIGEGVSQPPAYRLFVKLQRAGTLFTQIKPADGLNALHAVLKERAQFHPAPYAHWCLDGGPPPTLDGFATVSYHQLEPVRSALTAQMLTGYKASHFDPEALRTMLARTTFDSLGVKPSADPTLDHFSLSLLTEGSGTQIYSTTFVQWAAREALRRAQPLTLYAHYSPRQRERKMDELLASGHSGSAPETDVLGSLIDADIGAYYTWLNLQRLPEAAQSRFLVWFENHSQAVAIGPAFEHGHVDNTPTDIATLARKSMI